MREFVLTINIAEKFLSGETGSLNLNLRFFFCLSPGFIFFLLLVQKKEPKKSTPAMIYSHCRAP